MGRYGDKFHLLHALHLLSCSLRDLEIHYGKGRNVAKQLSDLVNLLRDKRFIGTFKRETPSGREFSRFS